MENSPSQNEVKAYEVLSFPHAEVQKNHNRGNKVSAVGILSVLYFPSYNRYILYLGDWSYALLRRLPVVSGQTSHTSRFYTLPAYSGSYIVRLNKITHSEGVQNFETILKNNSQFSYEGEEPKQREASPSDRFVEFEEHGDSYREKGVTETEKLRGKEKVKRGFKKIESNFISHDPADQKSNLNLKQIKDYSELKTSGVDPSHSHHHLGRRDVEAIIVRSKDIAKARGYLVDTEEQPQMKQETQNRDEINETVVNISGQDVYKEGEVQLIEKIENEKRLQEVERKHQDIHRQRELLHVERERALQNALRIQQQEHAAQQLQQIEKSLLSEIHQKEAELEQLKMKEKKFSKQNEQDNDVLGQSQKVCESPTNIGKSQQKMREIDVSNRP